MAKDRTYKVTVNGLADAMQAYGMQQGMWQLDLAYLRRVAAGVLSHVEVGIIYDKKQALEDAETMTYVAHHEE